MFQERIKLSMTVGKSKIPGGNIKAFNLNLTTYGFEGMARFWVLSDQEKDTFFTPFSSSDTLEVTASVAPYYKEQTKAPSPYNVQGIVYRRLLIEERSIEQIKEQPVQFRCYEIYFSDPASVLWKQHFPIALYTKKSFEEIIDQEKPPSINLKYNWALLQKKQDIFALNCATSFYDFLVSYIQEYHGVWTYDSVKNNYQITEKKEELSGTALSVNKEAIETIRIEFPEPQRYTSHILNADSNTAQDLSIENKLAEKTLRKDILLCTPLSQVITDRQNLEQNKTVVQEPFLNLTFKKFPQETLFPNLWCTFDKKGEWSCTTFQYQKNYRLRDLALSMVASDPNPSKNDENKEASFDISLSARAESEKETHPFFPKVTAPHYPYYVEGIIVSEQGEKDVETYQVYQNEESSIEQYRVEIPLWDKQQVIIPFNPNLISGHFYFPAYKGARVLISLYRNNALIKRFLEWRPGAKLPNDTQGNQILFGWTEKSCTSINHVYEENKPVFNMRRCSDKDTEFIQLKEGSLILQTKEESS